MIAHVLLSSLLVLGVCGLNFSTAGLANFSAYSQTPEALLKTAYQSTTLPTYGTNIITSNNTLLILSRVEIQCNSTNLSLTINPKNTLDAIHQVWGCIPGTNVAICNPDWSQIYPCGTFLQVHRPYNQTVLLSFDISSYDKVNAIGISFEGLCAGSYHIWLVVVSRIGKIINLVSPLYIYYPSC